MTHELAKKLKDAGFPQTGTGLWVCNIGKLAIADFDPGGITGIAQDDFCYLPTLSELIAACGSESFRLEDIDTTHPKPKFGWRAMKYMKAALGKTPEEAVSNLYLALHEKELA
jgi:hypothetical protein